MERNSGKENQVNRTGLYWPGKQTEVERIILPFQIVETVNESKADRDKLTLFRQRGEPAPGWRNKLIWGDNKYIMASLLPEFAGKINLIYIDPPFATGADFSIPIKFEDIEWTKEASVIEEKAYRDTWGRGLDSYLQMMYDRLVLMRELLTDNGSIYVHIDAHVGHYIKAVMDEIFGKDCFQREIIWRIGWISGYKAAAKNWIRNHDTILYYVKNPDNFIFNKEYVPYPPGYTRRGGEQTIGKGYAIEDVWNANPFEYELKGDDSLDSIQIKSFSTEKTGFPTQKNESVIRRIIKASSNEGDLIADFFCGSGTTGAVAEKLGRRWIMADLSKFAIHTTRKRLLDIPGCKPFEVLNLGKYQKAKLKENGIARYIDFVLKLYRAEPLSGYSTLHGKKAGRMVHIGDVDSIVTEREIRETMNECASAGAKAVDFLGWDFEMGLHDLVERIGDEYSVKIHLVQIPKEALEVRDAAKEEVKFFDLNYLELDHRLKNKALSITLKDFVISNPEYLPEEVREKVKKFTDYIDYWAVDFNYKEDTFHNMWQSFRTRKHPALETKCSHTYEEPGKYQVLVKVVDIFGNDTNKLIEVEVS
jgi:DNA modification methylase